MNTTEIREIAALEPAIATIALSRFRFVYIRLKGTDSSLGAELFEY